MSVTLDEPLVAIAATALPVAGGIIGAWWQRRREAALPANRDSDSRPEVRADPKGSEARV